MPVMSKIPNGRAKLARVVRASGDIMRINDAVRILGLDRTEASKLISRWAKQGWLRRIGPGLYLPVSIDALESELVLEEPWILVPALFEPAYISGWSTAEFWDLTEQIFRDIVVMTGAPLRGRKKNVHGVSFILRHISERHFFGTRTVWLGRSKVTVADPHRTIVDMLQEPSLGGGIQHVEDCFIQYLHREDRDFALLVEYADKLFNGAIFKRLGFLAERQSMDLLVQLSRERLTTGNAKLDSGLECPRLITRWKLFVPETWLDGKP